MKVYGCDLRVFRLLAGSVVISGLLVVLLNFGYGQSNGNGDAVSQESSTEMRAEPPIKWMRTELYFGARLRDREGDYETMWNDYLDNVVTPRFPEGLTVLDASGQWRVKEGQKPRRGSSRIIILIHEASEEKSRNLDEIREIWKERAGHISVLKVTAPVEVSF